MVSFVLMAYEQSQFVREAAESALAQNYAPLEVILSDDASRDGTDEILEEVAGRYRGPHRVVVNRNTENLGHGHVDKLMTLARGEFVVLAHGDDVSHVDRTSALVRAWLERRPALLSSNAAMIDERGRSLGLLVDAADSHDVTTDDIVGEGWRKTMLGATFAWDRRLFDEFGALPVDTLPRHSGDDHLLPFRASLVGGMHYLAETLVDYRVHAANGGHFLCDKLGSVESYRETYAAFNLSGLVAMRDSFLNGEGRHRLTEERSAVLERIEARILEETSRWARLRSTLTRDGKMPVWVDQRFADGNRAGARFPLKPDRQRMRFRLRRLLHRASF